jgi:hypothetical protein
LIHLFHVRLNTRYRLLGIRNLLLLMSLSAYSSIGLATVDVGAGTGSFAAGRPILSLALGADGADYGGLYRSEGVRTTAYAQNAWTGAFYKKVNSDKFSIGSFMAGVGFGVSYMIRSYKDPNASDTDVVRDSAFGPHFIVRYTIGPVFLSFDTLLGLTTDIAEHIALNFQDVSHVSIGVSI